jgi:cell division protein FtsI/penicillin-binding protein 2
MAIGQGSLTATPLQVLRMMAAIANGGRLPTPHVVSEVKGSDPFIPLQPKTLEAIRDGLRRTVADAEGTAHSTVFIDSLAIAGKTGTAETGEGRASHAWFAGYVSADEPKLAFVIVLEHAGDAAATAGPIAKRLVLRMDQLGML